MKLEDCRKKIDAIDVHIVELLNKRAEIVKEVGRLKMKAGLPIVDLERENQILRRVCHESGGGLDDDSVVKIYRQIIKESRQIQVEAMAKMIDQGTKIY